MKSNLSLRRIFSLVLMSVLLCALVTLGVYSAVSPNVFANAAKEELYPRAEFLADLAVKYFESEDGGATPVYMQFFSMNSRQWGATVFLIDENRNVLANTNPSVSQSEYSLKIADFEVLVYQVLAGEETMYLSYAPQPADKASRATEVLFIGLPVRVQGHVKGAVILVKPLEEIVSAMSTLSSSLWFSAMAVLLAMLPFAYLSSKRITDPLREMRDVALCMAGGDFSIRANADEPGEIGDMARAINHLSEELGQTVGELVRERNQAVTIINALGEGVLSVNTEGMPMMTNPAMQTMMFVAGHGKPLPLPPDVWESFQIVLKENRSIEDTFLLGELLLRMTITPIEDPHSGSITAVAVFHDETQAHRLEQTRREYVANVSHELRTPLTALRALIEPLCDGLISTEEKRQEIYTIILRETMRLSRLVDDMLELSRLQSGRLALEKIRFKVEDLLRNTAATYAAKAADTGHRLIVSIPDAALPTVLGNPDRTEQVLVAMLNNAFAHTPPGSTVSLIAEEKEDFLLITIEDDGPGIAEEDLPHLFDRFYKADKSHGSSGTGLGLAISREVMERLGEQIYAENRPQGGARFRFTLHYR